jgi:hypothetical protein
LAAVSDLLEQNNLFQNTEVALGEFTGDVTKVDVVYAYVDGQATQHVTARKFTPMGRCLVAFFGYINESEADRSHFQIDQFANVVRLIFGVSAAFQLVEVTRYAIGSDSASSIIAQGYASRFPIQDINSLWGPDDGRAEIIPLAPEAAILLSSAFKQDYPSDQFIFLWLAFEAIMADRFGSHNGDSRREYFENSLGSRIVNDEVYRLFRVRSELFKSGRYNTLSIGEDAWSLYMAIQLAIMEPCSQRTRFLLGYEKYISERDLG